MKPWLQGIYNRRWKSRKRCKHFTDLLWKVVVSGSEQCRADQMAQGPQFTSTPMLKAMSDKSTLQSTCKIMLSPANSLNRAKQRCGTMDTQGLNNPTCCSSILELTAALLSHALRISQVCWLPASMVPQLEMQMTSKHCFQTDPVAPDEAGNHLWWTDTPFWSSSWADTNWFNAFEGLEDSKCFSSSVYWYYSLS